VKISQKFRGGGYFFLTHTVEQTCFKIQLRINFFITRAKTNTVILTSGRWRTAHRQIWNLEVIQCESKNFEKRRPLHFLQMNWLPGTVANEQDWTKVFGGGEARHNLPEGLCHLWWTVKAQLKRCMNGTVTRLQQTGVLKL